MPRPSSPYLDRIIDEAPIPVLDHGFVRVVDYCGNEEAIERAARQSYVAEPKARTEDDRRTLLRYLMRHRHTSPLEMCELVIQAKLPIFVARQWIRHRTASVNELSGRYSVLDAEFYLPEINQLCVQSTQNKQGKGEVAPMAAAAQDAIRTHCESAVDLYRWLLADEQDIARELARIGLPLSTYTTWTWKIDLHNLLHFLALRLDAHAQYEIRAYADVLWKWVKGWVPVVAEAFEDYRLEALTLSRPEVDALRWLLRYDGGADAPEVSVCLPNKREREEFKAKLQRLI